MKDYIKIEYYNLPEDLFNEISDSLVYNEILFDFQKKNHELLKATGNPSEVIIFINQHLTELLLSGILYPIIYDVLKKSISLIRSKVILFHSKNDEKDVLVKNISLKFNVSPNDSLEFVLKGDFDDKTVLELTDKILKYKREKDKIDSEVKNTEKEFKYREIFIDLHAMENFFSEEDNKPVNDKFNRLSDR